jgi:hypothetical protein
VLDSSITLLESSFNIRVFCSCRQLHDAWPVYISLANHLSVGRNSTAGKRLITFITIPHKRRTESDNDYRFCKQVLYLRCMEEVLKLVHFWSGGLHLKLPGDTEPHIYVPRLGVLIGDLMEVRMMLGTSSAYSARCVTRIDGHDSKSESPPTPVPSARELSGREGCF